MIHTLIDQCHLFGREEGFDLLESRPVNHSYLVMLLLIAHFGIILNRFSLIGFSNQYRCDCVLLTSAEIEPFGHNLEFLCWLGWKGVRSSCGWT